MTPQAQRTIKAIVRRRSLDENTFAVVTATVDSVFADEQPNEIHVLFGSIQHAVTQWFIQAEVGKSVLRPNNHDFNIGDLAEWATDEQLLGFLRQHGIHELTIDVHSDTTRHSWEFDDVLFDADNG